MLARPRIVLLHPARIWRTPKHRGPLSVVLRHNSIARLSGSAYATGVSDGFTQLDYVKAHTGKSSDLLQVYSFHGSEQHHFQDARILAVA